MGVEGSPILTVAEMDRRDLVIEGGGQPSADSALADAWFPGDEHNLAPAVCLCL